MNDKQTSMEPAEVVEIPPRQKAAQPQPYYGTAMPEKPKKDHTALIIVLSLLVIVFGTLFIVFGLLQLRISFAGGKFTVGLAQPDAFNSADGQQYQLLTPTTTGEAQAQPQQNTPSYRMQLETPPEDGALSAQSIYAAVNPSVVCVQAQTYYGDKSGTGVIMAESGYIITTDTLVSGAVSLDVLFSDGTSASAQSVAVDSVSGLALILASRDGLVPAQFADADTLSVGDTVYCIGNPYGTQIRGVLTDGIVSAVSTDAHVDGVAMTLLQTTAAPDSDTNGVPVINTGGQVVAITTSVGTSLTDDGSDPHLAISAGTLKTIVDRLLSDEDSASVWLGIQVEVIPESYRIFYGFPGSLWISRVGSGTYADGMLYTQDVITAVDGTEVTTVAQYRAALELHEVGDSVTLTIYRAGRLYTATLPLLNG